MALRNTLSAAILTLTALALVAGSAEARDVELKGALSRNARGPSKLEIEDFGTCDGGTRRQIFFDAERKKVEASFRFKAIGRSSSRAAPASRTRKLEGRVPFPGGGTPRRSPEGAPRVGIGEIESQSPYGALVGTRVVRIDDDGRKIEVHYDAHEGFTNRIGTLAGAILAGLLDSVTGLVANAVLPDGRVAVHKSMEVQYLRPGTPGAVRGLGRVLEQSEREILSRGELLDAAGERIASAEARLRVLEWPRRE